MPRSGKRSWPGPRLGAPYVPVHNWQKVSLCATGTLRLAKSRRKAAVARMHARCGSRRGETRSFSPLANHPFSFGQEQVHRHLPEDLRHLLPQIRARFARKVRNTKAPATHFPKATRRADSTPRGRAFPLEWQPIPCLSQQQLGGRRKASLTPARAARPEGKEGD